MTINDPSFRDNKVCVLGLGYVGLTLATTLADVGFRVYGVEIRDEVLKTLEDGLPHFHEPGLKDKLQPALREKRMTVSKYIPEDCDATVFIITVGTPLGENGKSRLDMIEKVASEIADNLKDGDMVICRSTVMLGTTRRIVYPMLEKAGKKIDVAFCPERTLEGRALKELRELPQIVGGFTPQSATRAAQFFQMTTPTVVRVKSLETAEMIKLVDNVARDVHFAFANEIAEMCDASGISATEVITAGKLAYPRTNLPAPGPVGGPCLEKDPFIFAEGMANYGVRPGITLTSRLYNQDQPRAVVAKIKKSTDSFANFPEKPVITLMGIAFKGRPETDDLRGTMARPIFDELKKAYPNAIFRGYDAVVSTKMIEEFGLKPVKSLEEAFSGSSLNILCNNHPIFDSMPVNELADQMDRPGLIYDFWNNFKASDLHFPDRVGYMGLGSMGEAILPDRNA